MKNTILVLLLLAGGTYPSLAQEEDQEIFRARYEVSPVSPAGRQDVLNLFETSIKIPLLANDKYQVASGIRYEGYWTPSDSLLGTSSLQGISGQILFNRDFRSAHSVQCILSGGAFSDFMDVTAEDFRFSFGIRHKIRVNGRFTLSYGLLYSKQFFGNLISPFVDFNWKISKRLVLSGPFPISPGLKYTLTSSVKLSFFLKPDNATFRLSENKRNSQYFQKKQWSAGLGLDCKVSKHWMVSLKTGVFLRQQLEIYDSSENGIFSILTLDVSGSERTPVSSYGKNAVFGTITVSWLLGRKR